MGRKTIRVGATSLVTFKECLIYSSKNPDYVTESTAKHPRMLKREQQTERSLFLALSVKLQKCKSRQEQWNGTLGGKTRDEEDKNEAFSLEAFKEYKDAHFLSEGGNQNTARESDVKVRELNISKKINKLQTLMHKTLSKYASTTINYVITNCKIYKMNIWINRNITIYNDINYKIIPE